MQALDTIYQEFVERNNKWMIATANNESINAVATAKDFYLTRMQELIRTLNTTSASEWQSRHMKTKKEALEMFEKLLPKYGPQDSRPELKVKLEKVLNFTEAIQFNYKWQLYLQEIESAYDRYEDMRANREQQEERIRRETREVST